MSLLGIDPLSNCNNVLNHTVSCRAENICRLNDARSYFYQNAKCQLATSTRAVHDARSYGLNPNDKTRFEQRQVPFQTNAGNIILT